MTCKSLFYILIGCINQTHNDMQKLKTLIEIMTGGSTNSTLIKRAEDVATRIQLDQENLINGLRRDLMEKKGRLDVLQDIGPDETTSTRPTDRTFNPGEFVRSVQEIQEEIMELEVRLEIAQRTLTNWQGSTDA